MTASPFLLNATINHHLETYREIDPVFVDKFLSSIYVDDLVSGSEDEQSAYELYSKSKLRLAVAGFKLRKFVTNSDELRHRIHENERRVGEKPRRAHSIHRLKSPILKFQFMKKRISHMPRVHWEPPTRKDQEYTRSWVWSGRLVKISSSLT